MHRTAHHCLVHTSEWNPSVSVWILACFYDTTRLCRAIRICVLSSARDFGKQLPSGLSILTLSVSLARSFLGHSLAQGFGHSIDLSRVFGKHASLV